MYGRILETYRRLLENTTYPTKRYLFKVFNTKKRLTGLVGPRGTGKTTLMLQYIKLRYNDFSKVVYASLDNIFFTQTRLIDFVDDLYQIEGVQTFFLDEIHTYPKWNQELKNIYDSFPNITIVFSGSSSMDLIKGSHDLSRRGTLFKLNGMSFREYLEFRLNVSLKPFSLNELLNNPSARVEEVSSIERIKGHFKEYLHSGYYPFMFEDKENYHQKILNIIDKTIYEDIPHFYNLKTENLFYFKRILSYLATIPPGTVNKNSIAKHMGLDHKTVVIYLNILNETGLVCLLKEQKAGSGILKSSEKIYLNDFNLYKAISEQIGFDYQMGTIRELFFINMLRNAGYPVFYSKIGDFHAQGFNFEIGGRSKPKKQIKQSPNNSFLVKDDILFPGRREIPLYLFGFLY